MKKLNLFFIFLFFTTGVFAADSSNSQSLTEKVQALQKEVRNVKAETLGNDDFGFVGTSPYMRIKSPYDATNVIEQLSSVNQDFKILEQKQKVDNYMQTHSIKAPHRPVLVVSGGIEAQAIMKRDYTGGSKSDIDLTHAELDVVGFINSWATGAMLMNYDNLAPATGARTTNSKLRIDTGFVNLGNLNDAPWYGTIGQIYVPFGQYSNYMVTDPLTKTLARIKERAAVLGYGKNGLNGSVYGYRGDTYTGDRSNNVNSGGANLYYVASWREVNVGFGSSYVYNLADSIGMLNNSDTTAGHFSGFKNALHLEHVVPAVDLRGVLKYDSDAYVLLVEYIDALRAFDRTNLSFNGNGARPQALDVEGAYNFTLQGDKISYVSVGYGRTWESLAFNLPQHSAFASFNTQWFKSTIESIEYRHDWNYSKSDTASGGGGAAYSPTGAKTRNIITAQVGVYF